MHINWWAVIVAAIINMGVGSLWYSRALFANAWVKETGRQMDQAGSVGKVYGWTALGALVQAAMLAVLVNWRAADSVGLGLKVGLVAWIFLAAAYVSTYLFEGKSLRLYAINSGYALVVLLVNGALLASWR